MYRENDRDHSQYKRTLDETLEIGYRAFKVKVGHYSLAEDAERLEFGRKVAGKDFRIRSRCESSGHSSGFPDNTSRALPRPPLAVPWISNRPTLKYG